jgi:hypothetical protein
LYGGGVAGASVPGNGGGASRDFELEVKELKSRSGSEGEKKKRGEKGAG